MAEGEPSPWSHLAAHSLVSMTWEALGRALPKHAAWQLTSPASQAIAHWTADESAVDAGAEDAEVLVMLWAEAPMAKRRTVEYFMVSCGCVWRKLVCVSSN